MLIKGKRDFTSYKEARKVLKRKVVSITQHRIRISDAVSLYPQFMQHCQTLGGVLLYSTHCKVV